MVDTIDCKQCAGLMGKIDRVEKSLALQLAARTVLPGRPRLAFSIPIGTLFGLVLMVGSARLGYSKKKVWVCTKCGYFFEII